MNEYELLRALVWKDTVTSYVRAPSFGSRHLAIDLADNVLAAFDQRFKDTLTQEPKEDA